MNVAKVSENGQITVPVDIRRLLRLRKGDKLAFIEKDNGEIVINNSSQLSVQDSSKDEPANVVIAAMEKFSKAMEGEWEKAGIYSEEDLIAWVKEARRDYMAEKRNK